jgi:hypothetical protein
MIYSLNLLTTRAECDAVLLAANARLHMLTFRDTETDFHTNTTTKTATSLKNELKALNTYITAMTPTVAGMDPTPERDEAAEELRKKISRRDALLARQKKVGPEKLVMYELSQALLDPQIPVVQDLIAQVTAHRATLAS